MERLMGIMSRKQDEQTKTPPARLWWETLDEECPITLEPVKSLPYPPFVLDKRQYFDGMALANYMISRGMFENPLTREPLTYADCKRLDDYLRLYIPENTRMAVCCEAFCLKQSVRVVSSSNNDETDNAHSRAQVLRGEAAAALVHLFVYGRHTTSTSSNTETAPQPPPRRHAGASFHLYDPPPSTIRTTAIQEMDGLRIIDDDEERVVQSEQSEYRQLQQSFPPLITRRTFENSAPDVDQHLLAVVRETSAMSQQEQETRVRLLTQARIRLMQEARMRQEERRKARQAAQAARQEDCQKQRQEENELELARAEIETWRNQHWDKLLEESHQKQEALSVPCRPVVVLPSKQDDEEEEEEATVDSEEMERIQAERKKQKVAAKRRRQKERKREQKDEEQEAARTREEGERLEREKDASAKKCACCGHGILGHGFEKFGHFYCSTKCARTGTTSNDTSYTDK
jgi:hypothetical protein